MQTLPAIHYLLDPLNALVARNPADIHLSGKILFPTGDSHPLPWLLGDYTGVEFIEEKKAPKEMDADFLLIADAFVSDAEDRLTDQYYRQSIILRGNSGDSSNLYFRASKLGWYFEGRMPEFTPHAKGPTLEVPPPEPLGAAPDPISPKAGKDAPSSEPR